MTVPQPGPSAPSAPGSSAWPSLQAPGLAPVWDALRRRLEDQGRDNRGRVRLPTLDAPSRLTLGSLLDRRLSSQVDLAALEGALVRLGVGADLPGALAALGHPVSDAPAQRRAERQVGQQARTAARAAVAEDWPEPWADAWVDAVVRAGVLRGLGPAEAVAVIAAARRVLDAIDHPPSPAAPRSRVDLAAEVLGDAHALDTGARLEVAVSRALAARSGPVPARALWEAAGVHLDLTSGPALTWNLPLLPSAALAPVLAGAVDLGVPLHLSRLALAAHPVAVASGAVVLVVENPRLVEAAAQARSPRALVSAGGAPSGAVQLLLDQLLAAGAELRYHGDFDAAGLALCARMVDRGLTPWRMTAADYRAALAVADAQGVTLPLGAHPAPPTPWDPGLQAAFDDDGRIVHEERLLPHIVEDAIRNGG